ncbi:MAG: 4Fe-4S dicluster domain-containing protein [Candidatus Dormiibacterota bacterium]
MRYGFAIDQGTCIGCHACTVACKTEHRIPVGQFRTWVKYVDKGAYPATNREFAVMRCNHCSDAPCVRICPTKALFKRPDGIVDFDSDRCIGCKSCQQACPYDAIYIDEDSHTAAKCNFCAHRVDRGLEPACVVVCPTHSIWAGDLDDPTSGISRLVASRPTAVRAPEQNTAPNVFYLNADRVALDPLAAPVDGTYIYAKPDPDRARFAREQGMPARGEARTTLNTAHPHPWGWRVIAYLWTKSVAAGSLLAAALLILILGERGPLVTLWAPAVALTFSGVTGVLLIWDLKRPERFHYIFLKANPTSWLVWGALAFGAFSGLSALWLLFGVLARVGKPPLVPLGPGLTVLSWVALPLGAITAGYSALLFNQAEGRDLWQSPIFFWHLLDQALLAGAGSLLFLSFPAGPTATARHLLLVVLLGASLVHLLLLAVEHTAQHPSRQAAVASRLMIFGPYRRQFWLGAVCMPALTAGLALPPVVSPGLWPLGAVGGAVVQLGLLGYESAFVRAGQDVPLS